MGSNKRGAAGKAPTTYGTIDLGEISMQAAMRMMQNPPPPKDDAEMRRLAADPAAAREWARSMGFTERRSSNSELLAEHARALASFSKIWKTTKLQTTFTTNDNVKPTDMFPQPPALDACTPIHVAALGVNTTHRARVLRARVAVDAPVLASAVTVVLEDECGDMVRASFYDLVPDDGDFEQRTRAAQRMLGKGTRLAILEPFYKISGDGSLGIRVDNPREVVFLDRLGPTDSAGHQQEGGKHFAAGQYGEAIASYTTALQLVYGPGHTELLPSLLLNLSAAHLGQGSVVMAAACGLAALATAPGMSKAYYRIAVALARGEQADAAWWHMQQAVLAGKSGPAAAAQMMGQVPPASQSMARWPAEKQAEVSHTQLMAFLTQPGATAAPQAGSSMPLLEPLLVLHAAEYHCRAGDSNSAQAGNGCSSRSSSSRGEGAAGGPGKQSDAVAALAATEKEAGNAAFKAGSFEPAVACYWRALAGVRQVAARLLNNRALCQLQCGSITMAAHDAVAAVLLDAVQIKGWHRLGSALLRSESMSAASAVCEAGLRLVTRPTAEHADLVKLQQRVASALAATAAAGQAKQQGRDAGRKPRARAGRREVTEREVRDAHAAETMSTTQLQASNAMMQMMRMMAPEGEARMRAKGWGDLADRVPDFCREFGQAGRWPSQSDRQACHDMLLKAYELARSSVMHAVALTSLPLLQEEVHSVIMRLGDNDPDSMGWMCHAKPGEVLFRPRGDYSPAILHSFANVPARKEVYTLGTTHVAVGFLDAGNLCAACQAWGSRPEAAAADAGGTQPLRWVGIDSSAYAVAKLLVIREMMQAAAPTDHILQVWYSAAWGRPTMASFRDALTKLLGACTAPSGSTGSATSAADGGADPGVLQLLRHWQVHDVSLAKSRAEWLASQDSHIWSANLVRKRDRLAIAEYLMTGQLLDAQCGSVIMFGLPASLKAERALDESVLQTLPLEELAEGLAAAPADDIMQVATRLLRARVDCLRSCVLAGKVQIEVWRGHVSPSSHDLHRRIAALSPWTISWSNCADYLLPKQFHAMARACSAREDTVHFAHTMNWVRDVFGTCHLDYKAYLPPDHMTGVLEDMLKTSTEAVNKLIKDAGLGDILLTPPIDNARNVVDFCLYVKYHRVWAKAFFAEAGMPNTDEQSVVQDMPVYNLMSRSNSTFHIAFSYDPDVSFVSYQGVH